MYKCRKIKSYGSSKLKLTLKFRLLNLNAILCFIKHNMQNVEKFKVLYLARKLSKLFEIFYNVQTSSIQIRRLSINYFEQFWMESWEKHTL